LQLTPSLVSTYSLDTAVETFEER